MENTEQEPSKIQQTDAITEILEKAKAITHLMSVAAADKKVDHDSEIQWAEFIHRDLVDEAARLIGILAGVSAEASA